MCTPCPPLETPLPAIDVLDRLPCIVTLSAFIDDIIFEDVLFIIFCPNYLVSCIAMTNPSVSGYRCPVFNHINDAFLSTFSSCSRFGNLPCKVFCFHSIIVWLLSSMAIPSSKLLRSSGVNTTSNLNTNVTWSFFESCSELLVFNFCFFIYGLASSSSSSFP